MSEETDDDFYQRADAHIHLSNDQTKIIGRGKVSASMMYATARFNAWLCASACKTGREMKEETEENINYFVEQYRAMLEENYAEYVDSFDDYMESRGDA